MGNPRFSICVNDRGGELRLGVAPLSRPLASIGQVHWGLAFRGISVGDSHPSSALFCAGADKRCGVIPDSGSTFIMGPAADVRTLLTDLCDRWDRCRTTYELGSRDRELQGAYMGKSEYLRMLLGNCNRWIEENGINELPPLHFHVAGADGDVQSLELPASAYISQSDIPKKEWDAAVRGGQTEESALTSLLQKMASPGASSSHSANETVTVCQPAISSLQMDLGPNPVWIMGSPLFYEYRVAFDMDTTPQSISFSSLRTSGGCGDCSKDEALVGAAAEAVANQPWKMSGPPRLPSSIQAIRHF